MRIVSTSRLLRFAMAGALVFTILFTLDMRAQDKSATIRPISDFVQQQGKFCFPDGAGGCAVFVPPVANFTGWFNNPTTRCASVDYAGLADQAIKEATGGTLSLGTRFGGTVIERPLPDGRAQIQVILITNNALAWAVQNQPAGCDFAGGPLEFGHRVPEVLSGALPALADSILQLVFINTAPGAPLPDLLQLFVAPDAGQDPIALHFEASAQGDLRAAFGVPDGTPGAMKVAQTGTLARPQCPLTTQPQAHCAGSATADGFPAERIDLHVIGK